MLSSIPHDQAFTQLLISQIVTYYDKCCGWYKGLKAHYVPSYSPMAHISVQLLSRRSRLAITVKSASRPQQNLPNLVIFMIQFVISGRGQKTLRRNSSLRWILSPLLSVFN